MASKELTKLLSQTNLRETVKALHTQRKKPTIYYEKWDQVLLLQE